MAKDKPPKPSVSGITDLDSEFNIRPGRNVTSDDFTPITNLADLGPAISAIKRGQDHTATMVNSLDNTVRKEVKPKLDEVRDGFIELRTEHRATKSRIKTLEDDTKKLSKPRPHDCHRDSEIKEHSEEIKGTQAQIADVTTKVATIETGQQSMKASVDKDFERLDGRSKFVGGAAVTIVLFVLGAAGSGGVTLYTMQSDVGHLSKEQTKIREEMSSMKRSTSEASSKVQEAADQVEEVAKKVGNGNVHRHDPLELVWCDLSPQERRRQEKLRGEDKIPKRRCP